MTTSHLNGVPEHAQKTIEDMQAQIRELEQHILKKKRGVNVILDSFDKPPIYSDLEPSSSTDAGPIHPGQFYGQALATAVRAILTRRRLANKVGGPATISEIYDTLSQGGYLFDTSDQENAKRGLRSSIGKNPIFHKLPTGHYGLTEWFPNLKQSKTKTPEEKPDGKSPEVDHSVDKESGFDFAKKEAALAEGKQ